MREEKKEKVISLEEEKEQTYFNFQDYNIEKETAEKIAEDPKIAILSLKDNGIRVSASGLEYRSYIIVIYNDKPAYSF